MAPKPQTSIETHFIVKITFNIKNIKQDKYVNHFIVI
jgi:hypothetical protein